MTRKPNVAKLEALKIAVEAILLDECVDIAQACNSTVSDCDCNGVGDDCLNCNGSGLRIDLHTVSLPEVQKEREDVFADVTFETGEIAGRVTNGRADAALIYDGAGYDYLSISGDWESKAYELHGKFQAAAALLGFEAEHHSNCVTGFYFQGGC